MKAILLGGAAASLLTASGFAADLDRMPIKAAPVPPFFTWTGCYAGGWIGGGWGQKNLADSTGLLALVTGFTAATLNIDGYLLGGQFGCDYQFASNWVLGLEGAVSGGAIRGSTAVALPTGIAGDSASFKERTDFLTSVTGRVGYAFDRWLLYAKGGAAWAGDKYSAIGVFLGTPYDLEGLETRLGWTAGVGIEWAFSPYWSVTLEYDYYGFGSHNITFIDTNSGTTGPENIKQNLQVVKLGVNFHVWAGLVAPP
jgi:outer membrane immunogenic protein